MKIAKWIAFGITVLSGVACIVCFFVPLDIRALSFDATRAIGGSEGVDGPTTIFISMSPAPLFVFLVFFRVSLFVWLFFCWKSKAQ